MSRLTLRLSSYGPEARALVHAAQTLADERKHREVEPLHLLTVLVDRDPVTRAAIEKAGLAPTDVLVEAEHLLRKRPHGEDHAILSQAMLDLLSRSEGEAARHGGRNVSPRDLLLALATESFGPARDVLRATGLSAPILRALFESMPAIEPKSETSRAVEAEVSRRADPLLEFGVDLVDEARQGRFDPFVGREAELRRVQQVLARRLENHPLLVGEPGVGKTAIVRELASRVARDAVPTFLRGKRIIALDFGSLVAGAKLRGQLEERMRALLAAVRDTNGGALLFVPDLGVFTGTGSGAGDLLAAALGRGELRVIALASPDRMRTFLEDHEALSRRFVPIPIEAPSVDETVAILRGVAPRFAESHGVTIVDAALVAAAHFARRYVPGVELPKGAIDLVDEASARVRVDAEDASADGGGEPAGAPAASRVVDAEQVAAVVAATTGVPVARMLEEETRKLLRMEDVLRERVIGQDHAVASVAQAVRRARVGLRDAKRPIGSFLFLGPSGVGKTELAKALAEFLFDDEAALTRLDMSEFMEKHMVSRLVGSPPGYADSDEGGFLTEAVRRRPYSVVLFDEMEKAHPDVFDILLQVLEDGRLTDSRGRLAHFQDVVVLFTSNVGSELVLGHEGTNDALREKIEGALRTRYRPEFLNRIDEIVIFDPLSRGSLAGILELQLRSFAKMLAARGLSLDVRDAAKSKLVDLGFEPAYGARPLRRAIQRSLQDPLATKLLAAEFATGDTIVIDLVDDAFTFGKR